MGDIKKISLGGRLFLGQGSQMTLAGCGGRRGRNDGPPPPQKAG